MAAHCSLAGVATSAYVRLCVFDKLWASLMLIHTILDLLGISSTSGQQCRWQCRTEGDCCWQLCRWICSVFCSGRYLQGIGRQETARRRSNLKRDRSSLKLKMSICMEQQGMRTLKGTSTHTVEELVHQSLPKLQGHNRIRNSLQNFHPSTQHNKIIRARYLFISFL